MPRFGLNLKSSVLGAEDFSKNLQKSPALMLSVLNQILREAGAVFVPALKANTPVKTRKLRNSTVFQIKGMDTDMRLEVRQGAKTASGEFYGHFVRGGTRPHMIRPKNKKALMFEIGGKVVFAKSVKHPGTAPNRYHVRALDSVLPQIEAIMAKAGVRIVTTLADVKKVF